MVRTSRVRVKFNDGTRVETIVRTIGADLTRDESQFQHDHVVDAVVAATREVPYTGTAPLRNVEII